MKHFGELQTASHQDARSTCAAAKE
jgi:hypothetical protein